MLRVHEDVQQSEKGKWWSGGRRTQELEEWERHESNGSRLVRYRKGLLSAIARGYLRRASGWRINVQLVWAEGNCFQVTES